LRERVPKPSDSEADAGEGWLAKLLDTKPPHPALASLAPPSPTRGEGLGGNSLLVVIAGLSNRP
jgi:hypothetical protein